MEPAYPSHIKELIEELEKIRTKKMAAIKYQQYEKAADYRDEESKLVRKLEAAKAEWEKNRKE